MLPDFDTQYDAINISKICHGHLKAKANLGLISILLNSVPYYCNVSNTANTTLFKLIISSDSVLLPESWVILLQTCV